MAVDVGWSIRVLAMAAHTLRPVACEGPDDSLDAKPVQKETVADKAPPKKSIICSSGARLGQVLKSLERLLPLLVCQVQVLP